MKLRIATRNSALALWQANEVKRLLQAEGCECVIVEITSDGDIEQTKGFADFGYKGAFTKRIEAALLEDRADIAVHSMKDMHSEIPDSLMIGAVLEREDPRDAFICAGYDSLDELPSGAVIGTASVRRQAIIKHLRPELKVVPFRGNVPTRLSKLQEGAVDATILAVAGLNRLGLDTMIKRIFLPEEMLPAVAQGAIGIECRKADEAIAEKLAMITHQPSMIAITAERAMLAVLDGDCKTPICGHAIIENGQLSLQGKWYQPDGSAFHEAALSGRIEDAIEIGQEVGTMLKAKLAL